jgi:hypothetical protein
MIKICISYNHTRHIENLPCVIKLLKPILEHLLFLILLQERIPFAQPVELIYHTLKQLQIHTANYQLCEIEGEH